MEKFPENKIEKIPSPEEISSVFEQLVKGREYKTRVKKEDENGIYAWEIVIKGEDGGTVEYLYGRKGRYKNQQHSKTTIEESFFDETGFPEGGGGTVARYENGTWRMVVDKNSDVKSVDSVLELSSENAKPKAPASEWRKMMEVPEIKEECGPMLAEVRDLIRSFKDTHDLVALHAIKKIDDKERSSYPEREVAMAGLIPIFNLIRSLERRTNIAKEELDELKLQHRKFSQAVGMRNRKSGILNHVVLGDLPPEKF